MITTNVPLSRTPAIWGSLLCESGPIYVISFYLIVRHNSLIITEGWTLGASTPVFLSRYCEGLATKAKDLSPHEMRLPPPPLDINLVFPGLWKIIVIIVVVVFAVVVVVFVVFIVIIILKKLQNIAIVSNYQYLLGARSTTWNIKWMLFRILDFQWNLFLIVTHG